MAGGKVWVAHRAAATENASRWLCPKSGNPHRRIPQKAARTAIRRRIQHAGDDVVMSKCQCGKRAGEGSRNVLHCFKFRVCGFPLIRKNSGYVVFRGWSGVHRPEAVRAPQFGRKVKVLRESRACARAKDPRRLDDRYRPPAWSGAACGCGRCVRLRCAVVPERRFACRYWCRCWRCRAWVVLQPLLLPTPSGERSLVEQTKARDGVPYGEFRALPQGGRQHEVKVKGSPHAADPPRTTQWEAESVSAWTMETRHCACRSRSWRLGQRRGRGGWAGCGAWAHRREL